MSDQTPQQKRRPFTIIGLGNELLSDDSVGIRVVRELKELLPPGIFAFEELAVGGLPLLDYLVDTDQCIIVDAIATGLHPAGTTYRWVLTETPEPVTLRTSHQIDLLQVVRLAELMGADIPRPLIVYGIEGDDFTTFHDGCTEAVARAIPELVRIICKDLGTTNSRTPPGERQSVAHVLLD